MDDAGGRARVSTTIRDARRERTTDGWMCASSARAQDGSHGGDGPTEEDLVELRDVIIHCDGSVDVLGGLSGDIARDVPVLCEQATDFVMECVTELPVKTPVAMLSV